MSRAGAFFVEEAAECLELVRAELAREIPERWTVYRAVRRLRGSAQLARFPAIAAEAAALERQLRPQEGDAVWLPELTAAAEAASRGLERKLEAVRAGDMEPHDQTERPMDGEARAAEVGIEELEYRGQAALERALELREAIEDAIVTETPVGPLIDELFDLIRLGMR